MAAVGLDVDLKPLLPQIPRPDRTDLAVIQMRATFRCARDSSGFRRTLGHRGDEIRLVHVDNDNARRATGDTDVRGGEISAPMSQSFCRISADATP